MENHNRSRKRRADQRQPPTQEETLRTNTRKAIQHARLEKTRDKLYADGELKKAIEIASNELQNAKNRHRRFNLKAARKCDWAIATTKQWGRMQRLRLEMKEDHGQDFEREFLERENIFTERDYEKTLHLITILQEWEGDETRYQAMMEQALQPNNRDHH
jgi:hypothetical protein